MDLNSFVEEMSKAHGCESWYSTDHTTSYQSAIVSNVTRKFTLGRLKPLPLPPLFPSPFPSRLLLLPLEVGPPNPTKGSGGAL